MKDRNLQLTKRGNATLILLFSVNTNRESVAYRSFHLGGAPWRGVRKVTTGMNFAIFTSQASDAVKSSPV